MKKHKPIQAGDVFQLNHGGSCTVLEYRNSSSVFISHDDEFGHVMEVEARNLRLGQVLNPYRRSVYGVGFLGNGKYKSKIAGKKSPEYALWSGILQRGHSSAFKESNPSYKDVSVCIDWHNFQVFAEWFNNQPFAKAEGFQLDKDLLIPGNREYSPSACSFVPGAINSLFNEGVQCKSSQMIGVTKISRRSQFVARVRVNGAAVRIGSFETEEEAYAAYKKAKIDYVRSMAEKYKDVLHPRVYENLSNWTL